MRQQIPHESTEGKVPAQLYVLDPSRHPGELHFYFVLEQDTEPIVMCASEILGSEHYTSPVFQENDAARNFIDFVFGEEHTVSDVELSSDLVQRTIEQGRIYHERRIGEMAGNRAATIEGSSMEAKIEYLDSLEELFTPFREEYISRVA